MKNVMRKVFLTCALFIGAMSLSAQLSQHGLLLNGGLGHLKDEYGSYYIRSYINSYINSDGTNLSHVTTELEYKSGFSAGYRFRFKMPVPKSFHYDIDMNVGAKLLKITADYYTTIIEDNYFHYEKLWSANSTNPYYFTSIGGTVNYSIVKNLSVGLGIEPTFYFSRESKNNYDAPIVTKVAYNFKVVEIGITGKYGLTKVFDSAYSSYGKFREIQVSLFIPLKTK
jgi:hypothetical protein